MSDQWVPPRRGTGVGCMGWKGLCLTEGPTKSQFIWICNCGNMAAPNWWLKTFMAQIHSRCMSNWGLVATSGVCHVFIWSVSHYYVYETQYWTPPLWLLCWAEMLFCHARLDPQICKGDLHIPLRVVIIIIVIIFKALSIYIGAAL